MKMILIILCIITGLAYLSQNYTLKYNQSRRKWDIYLIMLVIFLILLAGLRTSYNDTGNYIKGFTSSVNIYDFLKDTENIELLNNPLFYGFQALIRTFTDNFTVFFMICAVIVNVLFVRFIKKNASREDFMFSMFLYVCLGTLMLSMAAQKQILTMSILTLALDALFDKKYIKYYFIVFVAGLVHTYAWLFFFLPLLGDKPWNIKTYLLLFGTMLIMQYFQDIIATFVETADQVGKDIPLEEVLDGNQMNILRVAVYGVVPFTTFVFQSRLASDMDRKHGILIQMCTVSLMFMLMGTINGANMFGRSANYFEIGLILSLPWLVRHLFTKQSAKLVLLTAAICFTGFYVYDCKDFSFYYHHKSIIQFVREII